MVNDILLFHSILVMDCNKEEAIIAEEVKRIRKKTSIKSTENCVVSAYLLRKNFQCLNEENQSRSTRHRHRVNYLSDEEEDASK